MNGIIYMHRNKINNKVYIGQTIQSCQSRWKHNGNGYKTQNKFYSAIQKYGWDNFEHIILEENLTLEELNERESYWIHFYNSIENGYNVREGGNNQPLTNEHKEKIRESHNKTTAKKVICLNTLKVYNSINEAMKETGSEHISDCCKKKIKSSVKDKDGKALKFIVTESKESQQGSAFLAGLEGDKDGSILNNLADNKAGSTITYNAVSSAMETCLNDYLSEYKSL